MTGAERIEVGCLRVEIENLGSMAYAPAFDLQRSALEEVLSWRAAGDARAGRVLLVEHDPPVITVSRRAGARDHLLASEGRLADEGVAVAETDRGGDITYHGPGQLVAYPIVDLNRFGLNLHGYMRLLEAAVIDACAVFGVRAERDGAATGVWVNGSKVCAMGVRIRRWVSMHGLALNVSTRLEHFDLIVPCGLVGRGVTSLERELGEACPDMGRVKAALVRALASRLNAQAERV